MAVQVVKTGEETKQVEGRKDHNGDEKVITLDPLKAGIHDLMVLKAKSDAANVDLREAIKGMAEKTGLMAKAVRALVNARAKDRVKDAEREYEQMALVFSEVGDNEVRPVH